MRPNGEILYPPFLDDVSVYIGKIRDLYNSNLNRQTDKFNRGTRSELVNILGVQGELIFAHHLWKSGVEYEQATMVDNSPVKAADFIVGDFYIDVKTIRTESPDLLVNQDSHLKVKGITHYAFVQVIEPGRARYWVYSHDKVSGWPVKNVRYSNAYFKTI